MKFKPSIPVNAAVTAVKTQGAETRYACFLLGLFFDPEDGGQHVSRKYPLTFSGLHGVISQKTWLFSLRLCHTYSVHTCTILFKCMCVLEYTRLLRVRTLYSR
jgi:hypothetical protein